MSILGRILGGIWDRAKGGPGHRPSQGGSSPAPTAAPAPGAPAANAPQTGEPVDVEAILDGLNQGKNLNWRTSIVDLMKLTGMDSSLAERRELAQELGYTGDTSDTATMNIWLHKQVMQKIRDNGGRIPKLTD
ncbi:MAG: DUF3597 domain-containing protein [Brevundimonas sp.]|uniref:DUF3597 domain-containing protein n=1 Tax=Brevundimonas sp. TaxID=1871086 RepID=UPI0025BE82EA|nr:DUF3597 domain-containing protein [Brevundimonas sp.]MBX3477103.1 DUF3597 domain-containing protein [Brevundimonas sp.]